jgi:gliding motility-associated-like protein
MKKPQILFLFFLCLTLSTQAQKSLYQNTNLGSGSKIDLTLAEEDLNSRKERTAVYKFPDGRVVTQNSFSPIHFKNENGEWMPITGSFQRNENSISFSEQQLPIVISNDGFIELNSKSSESVSYRPSLFQKNFNLDNLVGKDGVLEYSTDGFLQKIDVRNNAVKSSLFIQNSPECTNGEYVVNEELIVPNGSKLNFNSEKGKWINNRWKGSVEILNEKNEVVSTLGGAICIDAQNEFYLASYSFSAIQNNKIHVKIHIEEQWLTDVSRTYPVEIDPLVTGPISVWNGGYMPSCFMPQYNVDSIQVNVPAGVTVTGLLVQASYYADPFTAAWMSDGSMYFSTECGQTTEFTVTGANANLAGTAYLIDYDMRNPLMCCYVPTCADQNFYLRMHLGRTFINDGCNINYIYYDQFSLWPFTAYIEGHTVETFGSEWSVPSTATCTSNCEVTGTIRMKYGVPPYTITHPWMTGSVVTGTAQPCNIGNSSKQLQLSIPNCPDYCNTDPTLDIPIPLVLDACGAQLIGITPAVLNRKPAPDVSFLPANLVVCNNEPFDVTVQSCLPNANITWAGNGQVGSGSFTSQFFVSDTSSVDVSYSAFAELNGCFSDTIQYLVNVQPTIDAGYLATPNPVVVYNEAQFTDVSNAYVSNIVGSAWDFGDGNSSSGSSVAHMYNVPGVYNVCLTTTTDANCSVEYCQDILVVPATITPINIITPNGDNFNDILEFQYLEFYSNNKLEVFNRWGTKVFEASPYLNNWNASELSDGTYFYTLHVNEEQQIESDLMIKRN